MTSSKHDISIFRNEGNLLQDTNQIKKTFNFLNSQASERDKTANSLLK